jgi:phosphatidylglycerophosphate synthase
MDASSRMTSSTLRLRSASSLRTSVGLAAVLGLAGVSAAAVMARVSLDLTSFYPAKVAGLYAVILVVVIIMAPAHHPFAQLGPANVVTLMRAALVALLAGLLGEPASRAAAWMAASIAGAVPALDGVDGWLARRTGMRSTFGARFDMETDALHVLVMSGLLWQFGKAGIWVWIGGVLRYAFVAAGLVLPWMAQTLKATRRGKVVTIVHMTTLSIGLAPFMPSTLSAVALAFSTAFLSWSFATDVGRLWRGEGAT